MGTSLEGKVIFLAGAGGVGDGLAKRYAREGAAVLVGDIDADAARRVAGEITSAGGRATGVELDGRDEASVGDAVAAARQRYGGLDGLHANFTSVSIADLTADVLGLSLDDYDAAMHTDARGYLLCTRAALPAIIERGGGSILYTSSEAAYLGEPVRVPYAMSKSAVHALMRHVAGRFGGEGVRANVIALGLIVHAKIEAALADGIEWARSQNRIKTRLGVPDDVAALAALLMSDEGGYITGQVMSVNGGMTIRP